MKLPVVLILLYLYSCVTVQIGKLLFSSSAAHHYEEIACLFQPLNFSTLVFIVFILCAM